MANPLFQNILPEDIPVMLKRLNAYTKSYRKDEYIKHAGDPADFIGIIETGSIHVLQDDYYGNRNITASISRDSLFGEAFTCAGIPYLPVDIVAAEVGMHDNGIFATVEAVHLLVQIVVPHRFAWSECCCDQAFC